ncbi:hypothetical protein [Nocardioides rubriscoriae]|uniref:hypothetical protein n=1 Tax=Nocardioides rubriscoriae TaxID=642762 RepID=UPI0011DF3461|nr:hypothetical protein [Nocardioides rubriscoriae]
MNADPSIAWRILLTAGLEHAPDPAGLRAALTSLHAAQGWPGDGLVLVDADLAALRRHLGGLRAPVVAVGVAGPRLVVTADHAAVDGLGLLSVLAALTGSPATSSARGVGDRPDAAGPARTVVRRLGEVALAPPARVRGTGGDVHADHDTYVETTVAGSPRTAHLIAASVRALAGVGATRRVAVAVGVARDVDHERIADRSALLRLRGAERLTPDEITALVRTAPTQAAPAAGGTGGAAVRLGLRVLAPRLGSTLLVSHLGTVTAPGVTSLAFHPVTAGGSGLSLGASTLGDATTLTLRARARSWGHDDLARLLDRVVDALA